MADIYSYDLLGVTQNAVPNILGIVNDRRKQALAQGQLAVNQGQLQHQVLEAKTKQERLAQYQAEVVELQKDPSPENVASFMLRWPEFANETKTGFDLKTGAKHEANVTAGGEILFALDNNPARALELAQQRQQADVAAGNPPDTILQGVIDALQSGDAAKIKQAKAAVHTIMARELGPKEYYEAVTGKDGTAFMQNYEYINERNPEAAAQYMKTETEGQPQLGIDASGQPFQYRASELPRFQPPNQQQPTTPTTPTTRPPPTPAEVMQNGTKGVDKATGLQTFTSSLWAPGTFVYMARSAQEYAKVPPGKRYIDARDGLIHTKGAK